MTSAITCVNDHVRAHPKIVSCWLNVEVSVPSRAVTVLQVFQQQGTYTAQPRSEIALFDKIGSKDLEVTLSDVDEKTGAIELDIVEKAN